MAAKRACTSAKTDKAKTAPAAKAQGGSEPKGKATPKRKASAVLKPEPKTTETAPAADLPAGPTPEQIAAWRALSQEERRALREREAARIFAEAAKAHRGGDLEAAIDGYNRSLFLNAKVPDVYNNLGVA